VRFRLTLWHTGVLIVFSLSLFLAEGRLLRDRLRERRDDQLLGDLRRFEILYHEFGAEILADEFRRQAALGGVEDVLMALVSPDGQIVASSDLSPWRDVNLGDVATAELRPGEVRFRTLPVPWTGSDVRLAEARTESGHLFRIGSSAEEDHALIVAYWRVFGMVVLAMSALAVGLAWVLTGQAMGGVEQVTRTAMQTEHGGLSVRVPPLARGAEIEDLTAAFNSMLDRIERLVTELRDVSDGIAHDLRSPLTRVRSLGETILTTPDVTPAGRDAAGAIVEECDRLADMVNTMLDVAEANAGVASYATQPVDVGQLVREAHDLFAPVAEGKGVALAADVADAPMTVIGDKRRLQRVVANLVDNAIKYTAANGTVTVSAREAGDGVVIEISDTGIGLSPGEQGRVFDRFYRADASRSMPGHGMGLAFARAVVRAHGGDVTVSSEPGKGSTFAVRLPPA